MTLPVVSTSKVSVVWRRSDSLGEAVGAFESETAAMLQRTSPRNEHVILYVLVSMMVIAVILMGVVNLDRVVNATGRIVTAAGAIYVSPFDTGIVREVRVKAGEVVKRGQVLATLDPTFVNADLLQLKNKLISDEAVVAREEAEVAGLPFNFLQRNSYLDMQDAIWQKRQAEYRANLANYDSQILSAESQISQYQADSDKYKNRLKLAGDTEKVYTPLLEKGYVSKLQLMQATDTRTEMSRLVGDAQNQIVQYRQTQSALKAQREAFVQKWHSDVGAQLVTDRNDLDETRQKLEKAQRLSDLASLDAPVDAIVLKVGRASAGSVASGGGMQTQAQEPLFTLVPLDSPVEADVNIRAEDIGFIKKGDTVRLKLDAYRYTQHGTAKAEVKSVSEGSFTTDDNGTPVAPYFKVRADIKEVRLRNVPAEFRLVPGMTLEGDIMVGKRTILSYLVEGALRTGSEAMREP